MNQQGAGRTKLPFRSIEPKHEASQGESTPLFVDRKDSRTYVSTPIVTVEVGSNRRRFQVHEALLTAHSTYFRQLLTRALSERPTHVLALEDVDDKHFETFVHWLYGGSLDDMYADLKQSISLFTLEVYALAHKIKVLAFMNGIVDVLRNKFRTDNIQPYIRRAIDAFEAGLANTPLGQFFIESAAMEVHMKLFAGPTLTFVEQRDTCRKEVNELCLYPPVATEIFRLIANHEGPWKEPRNLKGCRFHCHQEGEVCHLELDVPSQETASERGQNSKRSKDSEMPKWLLRSAKQKAK